MTAERLRNWLRQKIMRLISDDIERLVDRAYRDGCYVTHNEMQARKTLEFQHIVAENDKLRELLIERANLAVPDFVVIQEPPQ